MASEPTAVSGAKREVAAAFARLLKARLGERLRTLVLFGSVARGEAGPDSDIDLLAVVEGPLAGRFARQQLWHDLDRQLGFPGLSVIVYTPDQAQRTRPLYLDLTEDAVMLVDQENFFGAVLDRLRAKMRALGSVRLEIDGQRYWDLKPDLRAGEVVEL